MRRGRRPPSGDAAGVLLARRLAGGIGEGQRLGEGELERAQTITQRTRVLVADLRGRGGDEAREGVDQLPRLGEVLVLPGLLILREADLDRGGAHEVHAGGGDDLHRGDLGDVPQLLGGSGVVGGGVVGVLVIGHGVFLHVGGAARSGRGGRAGGASCPGRAGGWVTGGGWRALF